MRPEPQQTELDFEHLLPSDKQWFSVRWLARYFGKSPQHFLNLIQDGSLKESLDMRSEKATRADRVVHRAVLVAFLDKRRALSANPPYTPKKSRKKPYE